MHFKAVIFDLDGVITKTADLHSAAWKKMFDEYLEMRHIRDHEDLIPFTHTHDYLPFVDGKPRYKGVESFLFSRNIHIPYGDPEDSSERETICGLGNRKNQYVNEIIDQEGVEVFSSTIDMIHRLKENQIKIGVASSSKNCLTVLKAAKIDQLFETRVDGIISAEIGLKGKPEPDIFLKATENLDVHIDQTVIIEDAVSGVEAGSRGHFGLVIGIARKNNVAEIRSHGADIVLRDLSEISLEQIEQWFTEILPEEMWNLRYQSYDQSKERTREVLCAVGNGYFGSRGTQFECQANDINYPGTYIAGVYNELSSTIQGRTIHNEDLVNCPNWLGFTFKIAESPWFDINQYLMNGQGLIHHYSRSLDMKRAISKRTIIVEDPEGNQTKIITNLVASMANPHLGLLEYRIIPINHAHEIFCKSTLDGSVENTGVARYQNLNHQHLDVLHLKGQNNVSEILVKTKNSNIFIAECAKIQIFLNNQVQRPNVKLSTSKKSIDSIFSLHLQRHQELKIQKTVAIFTNQRYDAKDPLFDAQTLINSQDSYENLISAHIKQWHQLWKQMDIVVDGDRHLQMLIRLHSYHLLVSASLHNRTIDASVCARGLHGEAYRGHIFWDELFIFPFFTRNFPSITRTLLMYRYTRLPAAKQIAKDLGLKGAQFPWQSGHQGQEATQSLHLNPISGEWGPDYSYLQKHVSLTVAYNYWDYYQLTGDKHFFITFGLELFLEIGKFWSSAAQYNSDTHRYSLPTVVGPDEYHEKYPDSSQPGINNNAYTNIMVVWLYNRIFDIFESEPLIKIHFLNQEIIEEQDLVRWDDIRKKILINISDQGIIEQFEGYFQLSELDWDFYRDKYTNIARMDRILKAEEKSPDSFKVAKQADTLMIFYLLPATEIEKIFSQLGYRIPSDVLDKNFEYYLARTSHGSTLSRIVFSDLANRLKRKKLAYYFYLEAVESDFIDIQGGTTGEGIHAGVMAFTLNVMITNYAGISIFNDILKITPMIPQHIRGLNFSMMFQGNQYKLRISHKKIKISVISQSLEKISFLLNENLEEISPEVPYEFSY